MFRALTQAEQFIQTYSRTFRHIQEYWCIFSHTYRRATMEESGGLPCSFWKSRKECPDFGKKGPDRVHHWVKFSVLNAVLRVSRRNKSKMFPWGASFSCVFVEMFIEEWPRPICCIRHIQNPVAIENSDIFNHILAHLEPCVIFAYSEPCHVQNPDIFKTQDIFRTLSRYILAYSERCVTLPYWEALSYSEL